MTIKAIRGRSSWVNDLLAKRGRPNTHFGHGAYRNGTTQNTQSSAEHLKRKGRLEQNRYDQD